MLERVPVLEKHVDDYAGIVGIDVVDRIRAPRRTAAGRSRPARERHGVRRGCRRAARDPRAPAAQRGHRGRLAGDARQRRVLRGHQGGPQRVAGRRHRVDPADATHVPREGARQRAAARRSLRLRRDPRPAARGDVELPARATRRRDGRHEVDLALPHRPHRRQPEGVGVLPAVRRDPRRVGVDDARVRARVARHGLCRARATVHRSALGEEPRPRDAVLQRADAPVRRRRAPADRVPGEPVRPVEGSRRRDRGVPDRPRAGAGCAARARGVDGHRRPRGLPRVGRHRRGTRRATRTSTCSRTSIRSARCRSTRSSASPT